MGYAFQHDSDGNIGGVLAPTDRYVAETTFHVRYAETDAMGIVHHANYLIYFEEGRSSYSRQRGHSYAEIEQSGLYLTVTEVSARFLKPGRYAQLITTRCWIEEMKSRSLTFGYEIVDANSNEVLVTGFSRHICITHDGRVTRIPDSWRAWGQVSPLHFLTTRQMSRYNRNQIDI
jgi:acyl-CoA thioester hydrolase